MTVLGKGDTVTVTGRRWFDRRYGNTYFTAQIWVNGDHVATLPFQYGYGDQYLGEAAAELRRLGYIPEETGRYPNGMAMPLWRVAETLGFRLVADVADVQRKRDLHHEEAAS